MYKLLLIHLLSYNKIVTISKNYIHIQKNRQLEDALVAVLYISEYFNNFRYYLYFIKIELIKFIMLQHKNCILCFHIYFIKLKCDLEQSFNINLMYY